MRIALPHTPSIAIHRASDSNGPGILKRLLGQGEPVLRHIQERQFLLQHRHILSKSHTLGSIQTIALYNVRHAFPQS
jgi:hypothetical protein